MKHESCVDEVVANNHLFQITSIQLFVCNFNFESYQLDKTTKTSHKYIFFSLANIIFLFEGVEIARKNIFTILYFGEIVFSVLDSVIFSKYTHFNLMDFIGENLSFISKLIT